MFSVYCIKLIIRTTKQCSVTLVVGNITVLDAVSDNKKWQAQKKKNSLVPFAIWRVIQPWVSLTPLECCKFQHLKPVLTYRHSNQLIKFDKEGVLNVEPTSVDGNMRRGGAYLERGAHQGWLGPLSIQFLDIFSQFSAKNEHFFKNNNILSCTQMGRAVNPKRQVGQKRGWTR